MRPRQQQQHVPRETFIALRARREAYRITSDFLYRDEDSPSPPPAIPLQYEIPPDRPTPAWLRRFVTIVLAAALFSAIAILAFVAAFQV
ncbi:MAG TPA: hypothetical protein VGR35_12100 [Tepidisphaeraceae bacterium]|nr:hypothetical protein [Tepidisphaeraceae bacterium]